VQLLLIRHAQPARVTTHGRPADPGLPDRGRAQAEALGRWLAHETVDALYTSPQRRARETAAAVGAPLGIEARVDESVAELDRGATEYIPVEELRAAHGAGWMDHVRREWGASATAFQGGVVDGIERIVSAHPGQVVAVVCHGGVINAYVSRVLGLADVLFFEPGYTSVSRVWAARTGQRVVGSLNEMGHLHPATVGSTAQAADARAVAP
jgi:broad specificity phosphatase PhoE